MAAKPRITLAINLNTACNAGSKSSSLAHKEKMHFALYLAKKQ
jgi:hypothetical protein